MAQERIWTCPEIALALGVSRQAVSRWVRTGKLRATVITVGARPIYRIRDRDFRSFLALYVRDEDD
jgi:predicted site-specific integrase-resolvase